MENENLIDKIPIAPLKIAAHVSAQTLAEEVNRHLKEFRTEDYTAVRQMFGDSLHFRDFIPETYLLNLKCPRFGSGEGKAVINESVRGVDEYVFCDITNYSNTYRLNGYTNHMSPDDNFQDLKRIIGASTASAHRVNVVMPFLYESRQHKRTQRESLDCAMALKELVAMGVKNIITFDAHDPRVQNAIPLKGFENFRPTYAFVKAIAQYDPLQTFDKENVIVISPDEGAMDRAVYMANNLGVDVGVFYKRRDYSKVVNGRNPIVAHEYLGPNVEGKTVIVTDDIISSGESILDTARLLKEKKAASVIICATFGLFTDGFDKFDDYYAREYFNVIITTNLNYRPPEINQKPWYIEANMSRYLASIINSYNYDYSVAQSITGVDKIQNMLSSLRSDYQYVGRLF